MASSLLFETLYCYLTTMLNDSYSNDTFLLFGTCALVVLCYVVIIDAHFCVLQAQWCGTRNLNTPSASGSQKHVNTCLEPYFAARAAFR